MDGTFVRGRIIEPATLRDLMQRSDLRGAVQATSHFGSIALTGAALWLTWGTLWAVPLFMVHGVLINFLYAGQHELSHGTPFKTKWLNEWVGRVIGFIVIYPRDFDLIQHTAHHKWTQDWERDGELVREPYTLKTYLMWFLGPSYWWSRITRLYRFCQGRVIEPYVRTDQHATVIREARITVALYAAIAVLSLLAQSWIVLVLWLAPMFAMKAVHQLQNTIEHLGLSHTDNILENTRSTRTNSLMRWMCWNMQYHTAHHAFPSVPFHRLRELNRKMSDGAGVNPHAMGYLEFQIEVIRKLSRGKSEADYPYDEVWISKEGDRVSLD
ncbi:MAG: fatty acid desaturase [Pseudomonadota bacterium]